MSGRKEAFPAGTRESGLTLDDLQRVQYSRLVLDIPPRARLVFGCVAVLGLGLVVMQSLTGHLPDTIQMDKVIHFSGYTLLSFVFVLWLRPALCLTVLAGVVGVGVAIEHLQPLMGRQGDYRDAFANLLGVATGASIGLMARSLYAWIRRGQADAKLRQKRLTCPSGRVLFRQGKPVSYFCMIQSGEAVISQNIEGREHCLGTVGPGDVVGILGLLRGTPQFATVTAKTPMTLYRMTLDELVDASGDGAQLVGSVLQAFGRVMHSLAGRVSDAELELEASRKTTTSIDPQDRG